MQNLECVESKYIEYGVLRLFAKLFAKVRVMIGMTSFGGHTRLWGFNPVIALFWCFTQKVVWLVWLIL